MTERQAVSLYLRIIKARRRLRLYQALPDTPFKTQIIQDEKQHLARLKAQKEAA